MSPKQNPELEKNAQILMKGTDALFKDRGQITFTKPAIMERKTIIEYEGRMRADGMEKFNNEPTYVSAVNFYVNANDMQKKKTLGALIIYVPQAYLAKLMRLLQYPPFDDEDESAMLDSCGTLGNIIAGRFKSGISNAGYIELEMSPFATYRNTFPLGVEFCPTEYDKYELKFDVENATRLVLELSMGPIPHR